MNEADLGDYAHEVAAKVFDVSTACLMAHSIRAVEKYLQQKGQTNYCIVLKRGRRIPSQTPQEYGRGIVYIEPTAATIVVDKEMETELQRLAVAHELGHILFAFAVHQDGGELARMATKGAEQAATIFERELCLRHDEFYSKPENIAKLRFLSLHRE